MVKNYAGILRVIICLILFLFTTGCAVVSSPADRIRQVKTTAESAGWSQITLETDVFDLTGFIPPEKQSVQKILTLYIEGDGLSWITRSRISPDPTPLKPVGLLLALQHPNGSAAYIARPCQSGQSRNCRNQYWTKARFSPAVINAVNDAIDQLKLKFKAESLQLIGFSGGGAVAALAAAKREDISLLITIAGNLDHNIWTRHHNVDPLTKSLNPVDYWKNLAHIPQVHFVGMQDKNIPALVAQSYADRFPAGQKPELVFVKDMAHGCCWENLWPDLMNRVKDYDKKSNE